MQRIPKNLFLLFGKVYSLLSFAVYYQTFQVEILSRKLLYHGRNAVRGFRFRPVHVRQIAGVLPRDSFPDQFSPLRHFFQRR